MSQPPPQSIRIPAPDFDPLSRPLFTPQGFPSSPGGHVPPALSPLDAFAMQGRLLQKKFEEQQSAGNRLSRLPATTIATEFAKPRPDFFRSITSGSLGAQSAPDGTIDDEGPFGSMLEVRSGPRPQSHYPQVMSSRFSKQSPLPRTSPYEAQLLEFVREAAQPKSQIDPNSNNYWAKQRSSSPEDVDATPLAQNTLNVVHSESPALSARQSRQTSTSSSPRVSQHPRLLVPAAQLQQHTSSPTRRQPSRTANDRNLSDLSHLSIASTSSSISIEKLSPPPNQHEFTFPSSPAAAAYEQARLNGVPRPSFNFSRPLSRQSRPSIDSSRRVAETPHRQIINTKPAQHPLDVSNRQDSMEVPVAPLKSDAPQTPVSVASSDFHHSSETKGDSTPSSFVYQKYAINGPRSEPRRASARVSVGFEEFLNSQFTWDDPKNDSKLDLQLSTPYLVEQSPPSPVPTDSPPSSRRRMRPAEILMGSSGSSPRVSGERMRRKLQKVRPGTSGTDRSTFLLATRPSSPLTMDKVAEEHLERGFEQYQSGDRADASYQWKLAATAGHGVAMLLYALACSHGWGIPSNPSDSQMWLQSAVNHPTMQLTELDLNPAAAPEELNRAEHNNVRAHFALKVYELGMSYSNGWGVTKDVSLALRCFEVAGKWGDGDAYAEAARCYLEGIGCRKDVKRAAQLYRVAESKGVAVPGNSWIHQERYFDGEFESDERTGRETSRKDDKERSRSKARSKSRTRALFSRKKTPSTTD